MDRAETTSREAADAIRGKFTGHDDNWIIITLWRRLALARREINRLRMLGPRES